MTKYVWVLKIDESLFFFEKEQDALEAQDKLRVRLNSKQIQHQVYEQGVLDSADDFLDTYSMYIDMEVLGEF